MPQTRRQERVASLVRSVIADAIRDRVADPRLEPLTSITRVAVSPDFAVAHIYISVMSSEARQNLTLAALNSASGRLRAELAQHMTMRLVPALVFHLDQSVKRGIETVIAIERAMDELADRSAPASDADLESDPVSGAAARAASEESHE